MTTIFMEGDDPDSEDGDQDNLEGEDAAEPVNPPNDDSDEP